jgi:hypothetical protein
MNAEAYLGFCFEFECSLLSTVNLNDLFKRNLPGLTYGSVADALVAMEKAMKRDKIIVNDRQLACARIASPEGQDYLKGMAAAGNYAWVNRSSMTFLTRQVKENCSLELIRKLISMVGFRNVHSRC